MGEKEPKNKSEDWGRSVDILRSMQSCSRFGQDRRGIERGRIKLEYAVEGFDDPRIEYVKTEAFLKAVDYYYEHRSAEITVNSEMQKPNGVVKVYAPYKKGEMDTPVVMEIKNYMVPQILEFAYLILRQTQKGDKQK